MSVILSHTFTAEQLKKLHRRGPVAIEASWFEESP